MATIEIKEQALLVTMQGMDKILALRSSIAVPLAHITGVTARPDIAKVMYMPVESQFRGVHSPGHVVAGTLVMADGSGNVFCDVHDETKAVSIDLHHDQFKRLIIEVSDRTPEQARDLILAAIGPQASGSSVESDAMPDQPKVERAGTTR
jgi:hypothetical protein